MKKILLVLAIMFSVCTSAYAFDQTWDFSSPADGDNLSEGDDRIREFKTAVAERLDVDHWFEDYNAGLNSNVTTGYHRTVTLMELAAPATVADSIVVHALAEGDDSELAVVDGDGNDVQITKDGFVNVPANVSITNLSVSNNVDITNKLDVNGVGDIAGNVFLGGELTVASDLTVHGTIHGVPSYTTWTSRSKDTDYQAATDLIVMCLYVPTNAATGALIGKTDATATPSTVRVKCGQNSGNANVNNMLSITMPVKEGDYWAFDQTGSANSVTIYEINIA